MTVDVTCWGADSRPTSVDADDRPFPVPPGPASRPEFPGRRERTWVRPTLSTTGVTTYLTLADVARRTGRHHEQLRQWCASGRLPCERFGRDWLLSESDLELINRQPARRRRRRDPDRTVVAISFSDALAGREALGDAGRRFGLRVRDRAVAPLALGNVTFALVAVVVRDDDVDAAVALFEERGGTIVARARP